MKSPVLTLLALIAPLVILAQDQSIVALQNIETVIKDVQQQWVPERRLAVFNIKTSQKEDTVIVYGETTVADARDSLQARLLRMQIEPLKLQIDLLPHQSLGDTTQGVITVSTTPLRRGPDVDQEMINQGVLGEVVTILRERGMFSYIQLSDGYVGYMMRSSIKSMSKDEFKQWMERPKLVYVKNFGQIYSDKKENSYPVSDIVLGNSMAMVKKEGKWIRVALPDGREGYVHKDDVQEAGKPARKANPKPEALIHTARQFTGHPYLWGGLTPKGFDCSGFTKTVYKMNGIDLPRDANMQVLAGHPVELDSAYSNLQPGDLLFFGRTKERITHVGMYIGNYKFIHSDGWVHINSFNPADAEYSAYRVRYLQAVRRFL